MTENQSYSCKLFYCVCIFQLAAAVRSGLPEEYVSQLPIHQDGSCNGLQHYAALGRDEIGAISVNLAPSKAPQVSICGFINLCFQRKGKVYMGMMIKR